MNIETELLVPANVGDTTMVRDLQYPKLVIALCNEAFVTRLDDSGRR